MIAKTCSENLGIYASRRYAKCLSCGMILEGFGCYPAMTSNMLDDSCKRHNLFTGHNMFEPIRPLDEFVTGGENEMKGSELYQGGDLMNVQVCKDGKLFGRPLEITAVAAQKFQSRDRREPDREKLVIAFRDVERKLAVNKTNYKLLSAKYGDETDGWIGKKLVLKSVTVDFNGQLKDSIQVEPQ